MTLPAGTPALQRDVAATARRLHDAGFVANHDGNVSVRARDGVRFLATPTAFSKAAVDASDVITVDIEGKVLGGRRRLFSEWHLHRAAFLARPDAHVVIHAHPPACTALGLVGTDIGVPALPEIVVSLGAKIPLVPYAFPKSATQDAALKKALVDDDADAVLIAGNGALTVGIDLEQAFLRLELLEHYAKIFLLTSTLGGPQSIPSADVAKLLEARTKAGLGKKGRAAS